MPSILLIILVDSNMRNLHECMCVGLYTCTSSARCYQQTETGSVLVQQLACMCSWVCWSHETIYRLALTLDIQTERNWYTDKGNISVKRENDYETGFREKMLHSFQHLRSTYINGAVCARLDDKCPQIYKSQNNVVHWPVLVHYI